MAAAPSSSPSQWPWVIEAMRRAGQRRKGWLEGRGRVALEEAARPGRCPQPHFRKQEKPQPTNLTLHLKQPRERTTNKI